MELKWLKDFVALAEYGNFSKAAEARFVTQPAFSRRIRALEAWLGASLVDRAQYPTQLTDAGQAFVDEAYSLIEKMYQSQQRVRDIDSSQQQLMVLSQHALAVSFFPRWMSLLRDILENTVIRIEAGNLHDIVDTFCAGHSDLLLSYASDDLFQSLNKQIEKHQVESCPVGTDTLVAVTGVNDQQEPRYCFDSNDESDQHVPVLSHPPESFFGKLLQRDCYPYLPVQLHCRNVCENALSEALKALVLQGHGIAWLPKSLIEYELEKGSLCEFSQNIPPIKLNITLYRSTKNTSPVSDDVWQKMTISY